MTVLVVGPESSCTKAVTVMVREWRIDAVHRSVPWGPDAHPLWRLYFERFEPSLVLVVHRDFQATVQSQVEIGHVSDEPAAVASIRAAYRHIYGELVAQGWPFMPVNVESLMTGGGVLLFRRALRSANVGLTMGPIAPLRFVNEKYINGNHSHLGRRDLRSVEERLIDDGFEELLTGTEREHLRHDHADATRSDRHAALEERT